MSKPAQVPRTFPTSAGSRQNFVGFCRLVTDESVSAPKQVIDLSELSHDELMERANALSAKAGGMMGWVEKHTLDSRFTQLSEGSPPTAVGIGFGGADARFPSGNLHRFRRDGWVLRSGSGGDAGAETFYSGVAPEKRKNINKQTSRLSHGGGPARKLSNKERSAEGKAARGRPVGSIDVAPAEDAMEWLKCISKFPLPRKRPHLDRVPPHLVEPEGEAAEREDVDGGSAQGMLVEGQRAERGDGVVGERETPEGEAAMKEAEEEEERSTQEFPTTSTPIGSENSVPHRETFRREDAEKVDEELSTRAGTESEAGAAREREAAVAKTLAAVEKRIGTGTTKAAAFAVLREAGAAGLSLNDIVEQTQARGLKDWSNVVQKGSNISSVLNADQAFVRLAAGHWVLACLRGPPSVESVKPLPRASVPTAESQQYNAALERELETIESRLTKGTIKYAAFVVLRDVGPKGLVLAEIVERTEARGLRDWTGVAQKTATMSGTLSQDAAFVKEAKRGGVWSLACFHGVNADGERSEQRQLRELAALERRLTPGTVKMATFVVLRDAGPKGLSLEEIVEQTQHRGLKDWTGVEQRKCSVHATILKDDGFTKLSPGVFALTCLAHPHATSTSSVNASRGLRKCGEAGGVMTAMAMHRKLVEGSEAKRARRLAGSLVYTRTYEALGEALPAGRMPTVLGGGYGGRALEKAADART